MPRFPLPPRSLVLLLPLAVCGCSLMPWASPGAGGDMGTSDAVSRWQSPQKAQPGGGPARADEQSLPQPRVYPPNEQISLISQRLMAAEDDRKVLVARVQLLENQVDDKERLLTAAKQEIQEATAQIVKTRNELQQWKKDMTALRDKLGGMEKENRETLETMIRTLEQILDRDKAPAKGPALTTPEAPPAKTH